MPKLQNIDRRTTKKLDLPSSTKDDPAWVEIYEEALAGDVEELANAGEERGKAMITALVNIIKDWNFENEDGTKAEVNIDNIRRLKQKDLLFLLNEVDAFNELALFSTAQKKSLATTS
jgi:hypothetical protein